MRRPSASSAAPPLWEAFSVCIFAALLRLYPPPFRRAYGAQMTLAFRASLRDAVREGGAVGAVRVWRLTLGDIILTAFAERLEQDVSISHSTLYRATGMVSLAGVALWIFAGVGMAVGLGLFAVDGQPPTLNVGLGLPVVWVFFVIGFYGLYTRLADVRGAAIWWLGAIVMLLLIGLTVGSLYRAWASQVGIAISGSMTIVNTAARSAVNEQLDTYAYDITSLAYPWMGVALLATAWLIRREATLRHVMRILVALGALSVVCYFFTDMGQPPLLRNTGTPGLMGIITGMLVYFIGWLGCWIMLGRWLYRAGGQNTAPATTAVEGQTDIQ